MHTRFALKTKLKTSPQLIFSANLLQVTAVDLEQTIFAELAQNPALELVHKPKLSSEDEIEHSFQSNNSSENFQIRSYQNRSSESTQKAQDPMRKIAMQTSPIDHLIAQVRLMVDQRDLETAVFLLYSLDKHGYIRTPLGELAAELNISTADVERVIQMLHQLDPPGIGARDLQECLLIQCTHLESDGTDCVIVRRMLIETWHNFIKRRWQHIERKLGVTQSQIDEARRIISRHLYPYPLLLLQDSQSTNGLLHHADLILHKKDKNGDLNYEIEIPGTDEFELRVSASFENALHDKNTPHLSTDQRSWTHNSIERARLFITSLNQRWTTLYRIGECLVAHQADFLERGPLYIKPLTRVAVAAKLDLHESTVGRAIRNKVAQLPNGRLIPLSHFFDSSLAPKEAIRQLLIRTNKPLSDREIAGQLEVAGINLARRTVTKYRQQLNILPVHQRQNKHPKSGILQR